MVYEGPKYTKVRNDFIGRHDLTPSEKLILEYLHGRMRKDGKPWVIHQDQVIAETGINPAAVRSALAGLKAKRWLTDNRKAVQGPDGRWRHDPCYVIQSRKDEVVIPDADASSQVTPNVKNRRRYSDVGIPQDYEGLSDKDSPKKDSPTPNVVASEGQPLRPGDEQFTTPDGETITVSRPDTFESPSATLATVSDRRGVRPGSDNPSFNHRDDGSSAVDSTTAVHDDVTRCSTCTVCRPVFYRILADKQPGLTVADLQAHHDARTWPKAA